MSRIVITFTTTLIACLAMSFPAMADPNPDRDGEIRYSCEKKTCKQMRSCDEAYHHLRVCGNKRLDCDQDGIPCENICRQRRKPNDS